MQRLEIYMWLHVDEMQKGKASCTGKTTRMKALVKMIYSGLDMREIMRN